MAIKKIEMTTGNNNATNNYIIRIWSREYFDDENYKKFRYYGFITEVKSKEKKPFNEAWKLMKLIKEFDDKAEKVRKLDDKTITKKNNKCKKKGKI